MEILPGFELVDDHEESMKAMILRQLAIDVGEATADVPGKRDLDVNRSGGFEDSFGERLWPSLRQQIIRGGASLILALDIACEVILHTMRCLLPPCLDFITGPHGDFVLQAKSGKALFNGLLDDALERDLTSLGWEASLTIQDDREKPDLLQSGSEVFDVVILDLCPGCALPVGDKDGQGREKMCFSRPIFRVSG
jgi:hypothetical protein